MTDDDIYGGARIRILPLPHDQYVIIIDRAGMLRAGEQEPWSAFRDATLTRLDQRCVGIFRYAKDCELPGDVQGLPDV